MPIDLSAFYRPSDNTSWADLMKDEEPELQQNKKEEAVTNDTTAAKPAAPVTDCHDKDTSTLDHDERLNRSQLPGESPSAAATPAKSAKLTELPTLSKRVDIDSLNSWRRPTNEKPSELLAKIAIDRPTDRPVDRQRRMVSSGLSSGTSHGRLMRSLDMSELPPRTRSTTPAKPPVDDTKNNVSGWKAYSETLQKEYKESVEASQKAFVEKFQQKSQDEIDTPLELDKDAAQANGLSEEVNTEDIQQKSQDEIDAPQEEDKDAAQPNDLSEEVNREDIQQKSQDEIDTPLEEDKDAAHPNGMSEEVSTEDNHSDHVATGNVTPLKSSASQASGSKSDDVASDGEQPLTTKQHSNDTATPCTSTSRNTNNGAPTKPHEGGLRNWNAFSIALQAVYKQSQNEKCAGHTKQVGRSTTKLDHTKDVDKVETPLEQEKAFDKADALLEQEEAFDKPVPTVELTSDAGKVDATLNDDTSTIASNDSVNKWKAFAAEHRSDPKKKHLDQPIDHTRPVDRPMSPIDHDTKTTTSGDTVNRWKAFAAEHRGDYKKKQPEDCVDHPRPASRGHVTPSTPTNNNNGGSSSSSSNNNTAGNGSTSRWNAFAAAHQTENKRSYHG